jgi:hypothetical protein
LSRNEAENKVWEVDSDIIARESDRRGTAARDSYERENSFVGKKKKIFLRKNGRFGAWVGKKADAEQQQKSSYI